MEIVLYTLGYLLVGMVVARQGKIALENRYSTELVDQAQEVRRWRFRHMCSNSSSYCREMHMPHDIRMMYNRTENMSMPGAGKVMAMTLLWPVCLTGTLVWFLGRKPVKWLAMAWGLFWENPRERKYRKTGVRK